MTAAAVDDGSCGDEATFNLGRASPGVVAAARLGALWSQEIGRAWDRYVGVMHERERRKSENNIGRGILEAERALARQLDTFCETVGADLPNLGRRWRFRSSPELRHRYVPNLQANRAVLEFLTHGPPHTMVLRR